MKSRRQTEKSGRKLYRVTPGKNQKVRFDARTNVETYSGETSDITGEIQVDPERPGDAPTARFEVNAASFLTGNSSRDSNMRRGHLQTDRFPKIVFTLESLDAPLTGIPPLTLNKPLTGTGRGTLSLHGIEKRITPTITVTRERDDAGRDALHIVAKFIVRLNDFKIPTPRFLFLTVRQEHPITVDIHAVEVAR